MNGTGAGDEHLIACFQETGEARHLDELFRRHLGRIRGLVYGMVLHDADADDVTQEIFVRVARSIDRFQGSARFSTWLYRVALNTTRTFLRRRAARPTADEAAEDCPEPGRHQPDQRALQAELDGQVARALQGLPEAWRAALVLTVLQEVPVREAARIEGCTASTLYWRIHQARRHLRAQLGSYRS